MRPNHRQERHRPLLYSYNGAKTVRHEHLSYSRGIVRRLAEQLAPVYVVLHWQWAIRTHLLERYLPISSLRQKMHIDLKPAITIRNSHLQLGSALTLQTSSPGISTWLRRTRYACRTRSWTRGTRRTASRLSGGIRTRPHVPQECQLG